MFKESPSNNETDTIIGPSVKIEGDFVTEGNIVVEGTICGVVKTNKNLKVGPKAKIFANVAAADALVAGEVQGNIKITNKLELTSTAKIFGDVKTDNLLVASGAILCGKCQMGDGKDKSPRPDFSKQEKIELESKAVDVEIKKIKKPEKVKFF